MQNNARKYVYMFKLTRISTYIYIHSCMYKCIHTNKCSQTYIHIYINTGGKGCVVASIAAIHDIPRLARQRFVERLDRHGAHPLPALTFTACCVAA